MQRYLYNRLWSNIEYICSFKLFMDKVCVSKINGIIKIQLVEYFFFRIPTNNFSHFDDFAFPMIFVRPSHTQISYIRRKYF